MEDRPSPASSTSSENDVFGIDDAIVPARVRKTAGNTAISLDGLLDPPLLLYEDLQDGCGGQLWPAGMVLSRYMLTCHKDDLADKAILELGAGSGLVGLAVARSCNVTVPILITDQTPMLTLMQKNIALNSLASKVQAAVYDWGSPVPDPVSTSFRAANSHTPHPDVVLAADCVYFEPAFPLLLQTLNDLIGPETTCYFCFKKRRKADWRFVKHMMKSFHVAPMVDAVPHEDRREGIHLYEVRKRVASG